MIFLIIGIALSIVTGLTHTLSARNRRPGNSIGFFSIITVLTGIGLIIFGMLTVEFIEIWDPPFWAILVPVTIMPFVFILIISTLLPTKIATRIRHPALVGVLMWSSAHLTINGDLAAIILFGSFALSSIINMIILRRIEIPTRMNTSHRPSTKQTTQEPYVSADAFVAMHNQSFNNQSFNNNPGKTTGRSSTHASPENISARAFAGQMSGQNTTPIYYDKRVIFMGLATFTVVLFFHSFLFGISQD